MAMNFNTANQTFRHLLGNGLSYRVPPFQRDYSWTEDEWDDLWQDILALFEPDGEPAHYLGYLVLQSSDNRRFDIIDGQQRLTTLSVMILALLKYLGDLAEAGFDSDNNRKRQEQLRSSYIGYLDPVTLIAQSKLQLNRHNNRFYETYLVPLEPVPTRRLNASEHQLRKAFVWFGERLEARYPREADSGRNMAGFLDSLADKLFFTVITVTDELNAFKVFETLNARGVRLSAGDLLKNYLFSLVGSDNTHEIELKNLEDRWERLVDLLENENFQEFLRTFWNSRHKFVRKADLFKTIRKSITGKERAFGLLRELDTAASIYAALRDSADPSWNKEEKQALEQLRMFAIRQHMSLLMACYARFYDSDRKGFTRILQAVAIISFRYNAICNLHPRQQESLYNAAAVAVSNGVKARANDVLQALMTVYPDDEQFKSAFAQKELDTSNSRNRKVARYILFELERRLSGQDFDRESASYSLEHILPENPSEAWSYIDESRQERSICRLGNMTLLEAALNRDVGNADYTSKRAIYRKSGFQLTREAAEKYDAWDEAKIESRQEYLAKRAAEAWRIEFGGR
ncbi:MAG: DUF262 domain-containing HNH endonuclease family protein [Planctomycetota bacterium]|jgi:hypothetical protein|nr:DUF262 domain-containing HNH endonuclease family protein [Planctomycetota bacterium]